MVASNLATCAWQSERNEAAKPRELTQNLSVVSVRKADRVTAAKSFRRWRPGNYCMSLMWACPTAAIILALFFMLKPHTQVEGRAHTPQVRDAPALGTRVDSSAADSTDTVAARHSDRCNVSSDSQRRQHNQSWWCKECGLGCYSVTMTTTRHMEWNCITDYGSWELSWSAKKKRWCCQHLRRGCSSKPLEDQRVSTTNMVLSHRSPPTEMPPPPMAVAPNGPCEVICSIQGHSSSCRGHVDWAISNWFKGQMHACIRARAALVRFCPGCRSCAISALNCSRR